MGESSDNGIAKQVRSNEPLVSRWAKAPEKPKQPAQISESSRQAAAPTPPVKEAASQPTEKIIKPSAGLESRWAKPEAAPPARQPRTHTSRRGSSGNGNKNAREPINTDNHSLQSNSGQWQSGLNTRQGSNRFRNHHSSQHDTTPQRRSHAHGQSDAAHSHIRNSSPQRGSHDSRSHDSRSHDSRSNDSRSHNAKSHDSSHDSRPRENKLAEHLGLSQPEKPRSSRSRRSRSERASRGAPAENSSPAAAPGAAAPSAALSTWSLDSYEPGEDWAAAEEESFVIPTSR